MKRRSFFGLLAFFVRTRVVTVTTFAEMQTALRAGVAVRLLRGAVIKIPTSVLELPTGATLDLNGGAIRFPR